MKTFIIVDDNQAFLRILRNIVEAHPQWQVLAEGRDGQEAVQLTRQHLPDVVLLDVVMPGMNGIQAAKQIKQLAPMTRIIVFSAYREEEFRLKALEVGAEYFVWKEDLDVRSLELMMASLFPHEMDTGNIDR